MNIQILTYIFNDKKQNKRERRISKKEKGDKKKTYKKVVKVIEMQFEKRNRLQKNKKKLYKIYFI